MRVAHIDAPDGPVAKIRLPSTLKVLLQLASKDLNLRRPAKQVFTADRTPVESIAQLTEPQLLLVSCMEKKTPQQTIPRSPRTPQSSPKTPRRTPQHPDQDQHLAVATAPSTVRENIQDALLSLFAALPPSQRKSLRGYEALQKLWESAQLAEFRALVQGQFIGSAVDGETDLGEATVAAALDLLKGRTPDECRFVIGGPPQSGKSTLLRTVSELFFRKIQLTGSVHRFLFVAINWEQNQILIDNTESLFTMVVQQIVRALHISRTDLSPILPCIQQFLVHSLHTQGPLHPAMAKFPNFPASYFQGLGRDIFRAFSDTSHPIEFLTLTANLGVKIATAFGMTPVHIFDHFDSCALLIEGKQKRATEFREESLDGPVAFNECLCEAIADGPLFVSTLDDGDFFQVFQGESTQVSTERIVKGGEERQIIVRDPQATITREMCNGCPGYCAVFDRVCELIKANEGEKGSSFKKLKSVVAKTREEMIRQELFRLVLLLGAADVGEDLDEERMNDLMSRSELSITVR